MCICKLWFHLREENLELFTKTDYPLCLLLCCTKHYHNMELELKKKVQVKLVNQDDSIKKCSYSNCNMLRLYSDGSCSGFQNAEHSQAAGLLHRFQLSKYETLNQLKQKVDTKATRETGLSWWQLQEKRSPENLAVTMAAHFMYIVLHASVTGFIRRGCRIIPAGLHGSWYVWLKVNIKSSLNVIAKLETEY